MIHYITPDQIFDLLGSVSCYLDLYFIEHYIRSNAHAYDTTTLTIMLLAVDDLNQIFH